MLPGVCKVFQIFMWTCFACYENASLSKSTFYVLIAGLVISQIYNLLLDLPTLKLF